MTDETSAYAQEMDAFRRRKDEFFAASAESPISLEERQAGFTGLRYFPPDLAFRADAELTTFDAPDVVTVGTSTGDTRRYLRYGVLRFRIKGQDLRLTAYKEAEDDRELFIPFKDATSGSETYGAGRYLEIPDTPGQPSPRAVVLDFNLAYNPYCAYSSDYNCPIPPAENLLAFPITAGERAYGYDH